MNRKFIAIGLGCLFLINAVKAVASNLAGPDTADITRPVAPLVPLDRQRIGQIAAMLPALPKGFGEGYQNRKVWDSLYHNLKYQKTIKIAEGFLNKPFPAWNDEQYLLYFTKGTRPEGENMMGSRLAWLAPLVWAECLEDKGRFVPAIEMVLNELIHQKSWSLPAHDKKKQNFEGRNYTVDLGAAGLAHNIAQAVYLLNDKLNPQLRAEVLKQMDTHVFSPVLRSIAAHNNDHYWLTVTNNWNSVCLAGVTGAALAIIPDKQQRAQFVAIAERYSRNSIAGFTDDGYCTEGLGYYAYGFGHYILLRENVLQATKGAIDLFADAKIKRIATYAPNLQIINDVYPNIADCHVGTKAPAAILWYCSRNLGLGLKKYDNLTPGGSTVNLVEDMMYAFPNSASRAQVSPQASALAPGIRSYFKDAGVLIERPDITGKGGMGAALKGGNNNESHNHNDVGSYTIVVGNELLMGDAGGPNFYTAKSFGPNRYQYKLLASYGHPVPLVAGIQQQPGAAAQAKILSANFSDKQDEFVMDISSAYPVPALSKLTRAFTYSREGAASLSVTDDFRFTESKPFEIALITRARWKQIAPDQIEFDGQKEKMIATIKTTGGTFAIKSETIEENAPAFTRIGIVLNPAVAGSVTVTFKPLTNKKL
ncbi:hypothetical protein [Mucilaginibacter paludis]|uniref:Heparinase II/III family protein n=1 Tax=Mucilaginibacter paludis DSM 18603 TaxID=714943 RepID=H1Y5H9_9SPHI|nr:hypothetical protein [Mucilaginibacter paludis]EHQ29331.1 hypothetical protein Mucpa_5256 [Mucilaginibacter paludis DSM 18603]